VDSASNPGRSPKIREVDDLLSGSSAARAKIREVHPEVCFAGLNRGQPIAHDKKTVEGATERDGKGLPMEMVYRLSGSADHRTGPAQASA